MKREWDAGHKSVVQESKEIDFQGSGVWREVWNVTNEFSVIVTYGGFWSDRIEKEIAASIN